MAKTSRVAAVAPNESPPVELTPALSVPTPVNPESSTPTPFDAAFAEAIVAEIEASPLKKPAAPASPKPAESQPAEPPAPADPQKPVEPPQPESPTGEPIPPQPPQRYPQPQPQNPPPTPPPQPQPQPQQYYQPQPEPPLFSGEEVTQLQSFYNEWPDIARATETMVRGMLTHTTRRMYQEMASSLAPYLQTIDTLADRSQLSELQTHVSDYDTVAGQLTTWAAHQPTYLRSAYEHVIKSGTAAEVVDLINRYKQDMQYTTPAHVGQPALPPAAAAPPAPASIPTPVNPALAAAAARLAPVSTKRTNVVAPPADFDSAFAEFARAS